VEKQGRCRRHVIPSLPQASKPQVSGYLDALASFQQRNPDALYRRYAVRTSGEKRKTQTGSLAVDCLQRQNVEALVQFHQRGILRTANVMAVWHYKMSILCISPASMTHMPTRSRPSLVAWMHDNERSDLLIQLAMPGELASLSVAVLFCSWRCTRILLDHSRSLTATNPFSKAEESILPAMANMASQKINEYHGGYPWWPYLPWLVGVKFSLKSAEEQQQRQLGASQ